MAEQCDSCKFYRPRVYGPRSVNECRVSEPSWGGKWPEVKPDDWCGKYVVVVAAETRMLGEVPL